MSNEILNIPVSYFPNKTSQATQSMTLREVLNIIQSNKFEMLISELRRLKQNGNDELASRIKSNLPAVTFCATFEGRRLSNAYSHYNNLLVIDIDKLGMADMDRVENCLAKDPYVMTYWKSPSGNGWKGLVPLQYAEDALDINVNDRHREAFVYIEDYFRERYQIELDSSGKDITRLCFFSWDPNLVIKNDVCPVQIIVKPKDEKKKNITSKQEEHVLPQQSESVVDFSWKQIEGRSNLKNVPMDRRIMENIYRYLQRHGLSITSSYEDWVKVAYAIANTFHPVYGRAMFMKLCELDGAGHDANKSERLIYDAYTTMNNRSDFSTIIYLAGKQGYVY